MSSTPAVLRRARAPRRRSAAFLGAVGVVVVLTLAGCSRTPTTYTSSVKTNFVKGCEQGGLSNSTCTCTYGKIEASIPFKEFKNVQSKLQQDPKPLDQINEWGKKMLDLRTQCEGQAS